MEEEINRDFNLPTYDEDNSDSFCELFHCFKCGFHPKVYSISMAIGDENNMLVQLILALPEGRIIKEKFGSILSDVEIIEDIYCGKCGSIGNWTKVPSFLLEAMNMIKPDGHKKDESIFKTVD